MANIHDIPVEILTKIFEYLTPSDRRVVSCVNAYWQYIWNSTQFDTDRTLIFDNCIIRSGTAPANIFRKTNRRYYKVIIGNVDFEDGFVEMWTRLGPMGQ